MMTSLCTHHVTCHVMWLTNGWWWHAFISCMVWPVTIVHLYTVQSRKIMYPWCCIFLNPHLQVHKDEVRYHSRDTTESKLERLVKQYSYPPSIKCAVYYSSPRDFDRPSLETFNMTISGTTKHHFSVPIKVYSALGESKCMSMRCVHRQKSPDASVLMCSSLWTVS